jgi:hypothetical protein
MFYSGVDSVTGTNVKPVRRLLVEIALQQSHMTMAAPESYLSLESKLKAVIETKSPTISKDALTKLAVACGVAETQVTDAIKHLSSLGVMVRHKIHLSSPVLNLTALIRQNLFDPITGTYVLDSQWLIEAWLQVLSLKSKPSTKFGIYKQSDVMAVWKPPRYPTELHGFLWNALSKNDMLVPFEYDDYARACYSARHPN